MTTAFYWQFLTVFMIHEFEEILVFESWLQKNKNKISRQYPKIAPNFFRQYDGLSTVGFSGAVLEEFLLLTAITIVCDIFNFSLVWSGFVGAYIIHCGIHLLQGIVLHRYTPGLITAVLTGTIGTLFIFRFIDQQGVVFIQFALATAGSLLVVCVNLIFAIKVGRCIQNFLDS